MKKPDYAPKSMSKEDDDAFLEILKTVQHQSNQRICAYCKIVKPNGARHCFTCKRCVLEHDKHLFLINNCVGLNNRIYVIFYFISEILLLLFILFSVFYHFPRIVTGEEWEEGY
jgi:hypothetical protein